MAEITQLLRSDLISMMPIEQVFQKHVVDGTSYLFKELLKEMNWEYELRYDLANELQININDIVIVGSAKLGFSLKTHEFVEFDGKYLNSGNPRHKSDIDVAVINRDFYDTTTKQIYELSRHFDKVWIAENWQMNAFNKSPTDLCAKYSSYLAKGWLRPDYFPLAFYENAKWPVVLGKWSKRLGGRKISMGFYSEWFYLKHYQMDNLEQLKLKLTQLEIK